MAYNPKDFYFKKAKEMNFAARSVFKLDEIDKRFRVLRAGQRVLDLGCAPGSWAQYANQKVGMNGVVVGVDLQRVNLTLPRTFFFEGDAFNEEFLTKCMAESSVSEFDVVLSDMAPKTTGIRIRDQTLSHDLCMRALDVARRFLKPGGGMVVKFFHSGEFESLMGEMKKTFSRVEVLRPKSTRKESKEVFLIGLGKLV